MTEKQIQSNGPNSPFQEKIELEHYFPGANFDEILVGIEGSVNSGVPMMVLTGVEGSGKSMLCHLIKAKLGTKYRIVYFPQTVDSFGDVVNTIAQSLGVQQASDAKIEKVETVLEFLTARLQEEAVPALIIFDDAENIYLATLERIRKMLDRITEKGSSLHILFSGRESFKGNYEQLSICDFQDVAERHFTLDQLSETETSEYLLQTGEKLDQHAVDSIFSKEVLKHIYEVAKGNFRMTNILAEEAWQRQGDDNSFMVLLENVKEEVEAGFEESKDFSIASLVQEYRHYLPWGAGLLLLVVLFMFSFGSEEESGGERSQEITIEYQQPQSKSQTQAEPAIKEPAKSVEIEKTVAKPTVPTIVKEERDNQSETAYRVPQPEIKVEKQQVEVNKKNDLPTITVEKSVEENTLEQRAEKKEPVVDFSPKQTETPREVVEESIPIPTANEVAETTVSLIEEAPVTKSVPLIEIKPIEKKQKLDPDLVAQDTSVQTIVELRPQSNMKRKPGSSKESVSPARSRVLQPSQQNRMVPTAKRSVDQLVRDRMVAGKSWEKGTKDNLFTVQLMVLTSKTAEQNLRRMLLEDRYRQEAGNFYIFKKKDNPDNIMVFYGEYRTIARARLAQNSLPQFLREHKPYAISVKGAMAKVSRE